MKDRNWDVFWIVFGATITLLVLVLMVSFGTVFRATLFVNTNKVCDYTFNKSEGTM